MQGHHLSQSIHRTRYEILCSYVVINVIIGCKNLFRTKKSGSVFALTNELTRTEHDHKIEWLSTRSIVMCLNIPAVWFVILYKNNLNIDKIQLTLFFTTSEKRIVIPYSRRSFDRGHQRSFKMTGSQVINELCFARNYVTFYTVAHAIQSVSAILWRHWRGSRSTTEAQGTT